MLIKTKTHREIEKRFNCKRGSLKKAVSYLQKAKYNIPEVVKGCEDYCNHYGSDFTVAFNLYVSCLKDPNEKHSKIHWLRKNLERKIATKLVKVLE
jgi:hypothetical protein